MVTMDTREAVAMVCERMATARVEVAIVGPSWSWLSVAARSPILGQLGRRVIAAGTITIGLDNGSHLRLLRPPDLDRILPGLHLDLAWVHGDLDGLGWAYLRSRFAPDDPEIITSY
jgi:hypothetical protein